MSKTVTFRPDHVYEVTGIWVAEGKLEQLDDYFSKVFPIAAADYGVKPLFSLEPKSAYAGDFLPHILFVNEWPSLESFEGFIADPRARELFPQRDAAVDHLVVTHYAVPAKTEVTLTEGDIVEFAAMWIKRGKEEALQNYYQSVVPIAKKNGLQPITPLQPLSSYRGRFLPTRAGLNLWRLQSNFEDFARDAEPLFSQRDVTLDRLEVTHAAVHFEGAR